jgi:sensor histidine kinase YesM/DUF4097 and DUF4098 domain-containing protein YvlB
MPGPEIVKSWPSEGIRRIETESLFGNVHLRGHESNKIRVEVSVRRYGWQFWIASHNSQTVLDNFNIHLEQQDEILLIKAFPKNGMINWLRFIGIHFRILVPQNRALETNIRLEAGNIRLEDCPGKHQVSTGAGMLRLERLKGEVDGRTSAGSIDIRDCKANITAQTSAGTIEARDSEGTITLTTSAGTIEMYSLVGNIYATSSAGTIEARDIDGVLKVSTSAGTIEVRDMNGSLGASTNLGTIEAEIVAPGEFLHLESQAGNIDVQMPVSKGMDLNISGTVVRAPRFEHFEGIFERNRIEGKVMEGGIPVHIRANAGNVRIGSSRSGTFRSINKTLKDHTFTLPPGFFHLDLKGVLLALGICLMLTYGVSSIMYFSIELTHNNALSDIYLGVVMGNVINAVTALALVFAFTKYLAHHIRHNWVKYLVLNVLAFVFSILGQLLLILVYWQYIESDDSDENTLSLSFLYMFIPCIVTSIYFFFWQRSQQITRKISEQEFQLVSLEKLKTRAELDALQARINPHFLYNSLNSIAGLVHEDADKAERMTLLLSRLFRFTIGTKDQHFNTVEHELDIVRTYLDIEQVRFGNRLTYNLEVEEGLSQVKIPVFLLQPIVENAIKHGISKISGDGRIEVKITRSNNRIVLSIHDNGPAFPENFFTGYGLQSIQDKIKLLYAEQATFDIQNIDYKQVIIQLPC